MLKTRSYYEGGREVKTPITDCERACERMISGTHEWEDNTTCLLSNDPRQEGTGPGVLIGSWGVNLLLHNLQLQAWHL